MIVQRLLAALLQRLYPTYHRPLSVAFCVYSPDYTYMHSGVRCLHLLCHHLNRLGYRSYVTTQVTNPSLNTPVANTKMLERVRRDGIADIAIYPETTEGN